MLTMIHSKYFIAPIVVASILLTASCNRNQDDAVLAKVNGSEINESDIKLIAKRLGSHASMIEEDPQVYRKALESLVTMRAIALKQESVMDANERNELERRVQHYREELLMEAYLKANTQAQIPTEQEIQDYYTKFPERFGGVRVSQYDMLQASGTQQTEAVLKALTTAATEKDWSAYAARIKKQGLPMLYIRGNTEGPNSSSQLLSAIKPLKSGEVSAIFYDDSIPYRLKITSVVNREPRPLKEVRSDIRKTLVAQAVKESIKIAAETVLAESKVKYSDAK